MGQPPGSDDGRLERGKMDREERHSLESIVFAYLVGEMGMEPIRARKTVENMTDAEIEIFFE